MSSNDLQAENAELRQQIEDHRLRELSELRELLAQARADAAHFRAEAERNVELGRQIHREAEAERIRLQTRIQSLERLPNGRAAQS
jgi:hypothetical protein